MNKEKLPFKTWLYFLGQSITMISMVMAVSMAALAGTSLAPQAWMATIPFGFQYLTLMVVAYPAARLMARLGRKKVFLMAAVPLMLAGVAGYIAMQERSFVLLISVFWLGRRVAALQWAALAVSYLGVFLVFLHDIDMDVGARKDLLLGAILVLCSGLSYSLYLITSGEVVRRLGAIRLTAWASLVASVFCIGQALLGLGVDLGEGDVRVGLGGLLVDGAEAHARAAPGGPEVDERNALAVDGVLELGPGDVLGGHERSFQDCGY